MRIVDVGTGVPVVMVPGIQGRWEWMRPAVDALAQRTRVITFSLSDEPTSGGCFVAARGFDNYVEQVGEAMNACGVERAVVCGVSYGGAVAAAFAARHPERVQALVLVSALPPSWTGDARVRFYARHPWLCAPLFCLGSFRLYHEVAVAHDTWSSGVLAAVRLAGTAIRHMFHPGRMARRVVLLAGARFARDLDRLHVPTLVMTGEESLERVVPPAETRRYLDVWPHAHLATLRRTGHLGLVTRPAAFAAAVSEFVAEYAEPRAA